MLLNSIRRILLYFRGHKFIQNLVTLEFGNVLGNVLQAVAGIIMARILQPELFGVYALVFSLAGLISIFMSVGAQDAVTTILSGAYARKDEATMKEALAFLAKMTIITGAIVFIGALCAPLISQFFYQDYKIGFYSGIIICASIISTTAFSFSMIALQVAGRIRAMTTLGFFNNTLRTVFALIAVVLGFGVLGIVMGHLFGAIIIFVAASFLWKSVQREFTIFPHIRGLLGSIRAVPIKKYFSFSFLIAVDRNLSNLYNILPITLTGIYLSTSEVTFFKLAFSYINLVLSFFGPVGTLLNVEFPRLRAIDNLRLGRNFFNVSMYSFMVSSLMTLGAIIVAPYAFKIVYGETFVQSVYYVYGLGIYGCIMGLGIGLGSMIRTLNLVSFSVKLHLISLCIGIPLGLMMIKYWGVWGTITLVTGWYSSIIVIAFIFILQILKKIQKN